MPKGGSSTREYRIWDKEEEDALRDGVKKHGLGAWERIRTDPAYSVLLGRTGVQLKDKWRNLVKFRHVSTQETQNLQHCGNWHRRAGDVRRKRARSSHNSEPDEPPSSTGEQGPRPGRSGPTTSLEAEMQAQQAMRKSQRASAFQRRSWAAAAELGLAAEGLEDDAGNGDNEHESSSDGSEGRQHRKRRRVPRNHQEDRRFGIYDRRRYTSLSPGRSHGSDGAPDIAAGAGDEGAAGAAGAAPGGRHRRAAAAGGGGTSRIQRRRPEPGGTSDAEEHAEGSEGDDEDEEGEEEYTVDCPCGVRYDDGEMMIECESCKAWSHTRCLQEQMAANPLCKYNFMHFNCMRCQRAQARQRQQLLGRAAAAAAAAAEQQGLVPGGGRSWDQPPGAAAAAAGNGVPRQRQGRGGGSGRRYRRRSPDYGERSSSGDEDQAQASGSGYGMEDSDGVLEASMEDYLVDIDPVLLLILQGALYINRRRRNAAMRHPRKEACGWGRVMLANTQHPAGGWLPALKTEPQPPAWRSEAAGGGGSSWRRHMPPPQQQHSRGGWEGLPGACASDEDLDWGHAARHRGVPGTWGMREPQSRKGSWQQQQQQRQPQPGPPRVTAVKSSSMLRTSGLPGSSRPYSAPLQQQQRPDGLPAWHSSAASLPAALLGMQASAGGSGGLMPPMAEQGDPGGLHLLAAVAPGSPTEPEEPAAAAGGLTASHSGRRHPGDDAGMGPSHAASGRSLVPGRLQPPPGWGRPLSPMQAHGSSAGGRPGDPVGSRPLAGAVGPAGGGRGTGRGGQGGPVEALPDAGLLLNAVHDLRPPTPDPFGLFRSHTPEHLLALHGLHLHLGGLGDVPGGGSWPLSKTPPLPDGLLGLTAGLASTSGHLHFSLDAPSGGGKGPEVGSEGAAAGAAVAAASGLPGAAAADNGGGGGGTVAAAAAAAGGAKHLSIDELVLQPLAKVEGSGGKVAAAPTPPPSLAAAMAAMASGLDTKPGALSSSSFGAAGNLPGQSPIQPQQQQQQQQQQHNGGGPPSHSAAAAATDKDAKDGGRQDPAIGPEAAQDAAGVEAPAANGGLPMEAAAPMGGVPALLSSGKASLGTALAAVAASGGGSTAGGGPAAAAQLSLGAALAAAVEGVRPHQAAPAAAGPASWPVPQPESTSTPQHLSWGAASAAAAAAHEGQPEQQQQQQQQPAPAPAPAPLPLSAGVGASPPSPPAAWASLGAALAAATATEQPPGPKTLPAADATQQH